MRDRAFYAYAERVEQLDRATFCIFDVVEKTDHIAFSRQYTIDSDEIVPQYHSSTLELYIDQKSSSSHNAIPLPIEHYWYEIPIADREGKHSTKIFRDEEESLGENVNIGHPTRIDGRSRLGRELWSTYSTRMLRTNDKQPHKHNDYNPFCKALCHDVGQGSCASLWSTYEPQLFVDFGCGYGSHASASHKRVQQYYKGQPIILTHWHKDHYAQVFSNPKALDAHWIVPEACYGPSAHKLATQLSARRKLHIIHWGEQQLHLQRTLEIQKINAGRHPHASGLAVFMNTGHHPICPEGCVMFPGDAPYRYISGHKHISALIAAHHGSDKSHGTRIGPPPEAFGARHVVYSFGYANHHRHPSDNTLITNLKHGWVNQSNTLHGDIHVHGCGADACCNSCFGGWRRCFR